MKKKKNGTTEKNGIPFRLNVLFFAVFILFSALILRLGFIQIVQGDEFEREQEQTSSEAVRIDAPRGLMYDRNGELVVDNELVLTLTYTNEQSVSDEERIRIATELSEIIEVDDDDIENIPERDLKDYWLVTHPDEALSLITQEDRDSVEEDEELYQIQLDRISDEQLQELDPQREIIAIWREMTSGYYDSPQRIKKGLAQEEAHRISERLDDLPGVDILRDANRNYLYEDAFPRFFGRIGSIPRESVDQYLAKGYDRSDEVGTSFLEQYYEEALRGQKGEVSNDSREESSGSRGHDLVLSVDMALQQEVETIIDNEVDSAAGSFINDKSAYVVMMEPDTGELLAVAGYSDQIGTIASSFEMGSTVKPATVLLGLETGVISEHTVVYDRTINLPSTPPISSVSALGPVNYLSALERSSNVYMAHIAMEMAGYQYGVSQTWNVAQYNKAYDTFRYYYEQFGLGVETGIDLPYETTGINGGNQSPGNLLYLSFGQFDTYTPMQLAQYTAAIANDGYRMKPQLVKQIREPNADKSELGAVRQQFEPTVLNKVDIDERYIHMAQQGMWRVVNGSRGTARSYFNNTDYVAAGKTGTAEITVRREGTDNYVDGNNQAFIGYAPYDDPEVAIAVIVPNVYVSGTSGIANRIARSSLDAYFDLKEERPDIEPAGEETSE
ncbi:cell elongation-specific peptidoglycan D,D-transpeptidase [Alteribacillus persepolensis]|uniref:serine-type D-Ala-D-Ala carboxypeptidase n=1 Tax=Alteribacillus persepolensis TaxID=568899 RepID=A0A1G8CV25_9BACI|nr:penicillin-binding transpeptidase domain-containing protein [Alteribacillus persepolensis]SDH49351.1 cell elongation-specific peptidoglycan D,D-transpeptidase [Alteribacillus persepolensis]